MDNVNQLRFQELPNSKIIITENVFNRLNILIGRSSWEVSEHSATLFGRKIDGENTWIIDEVNDNDDYISEGTFSLNPANYAIQMGVRQYDEMMDKVKKNTGTVVIDVHTHPSGLIEDYRFISNADLLSCKNLCKLVSSVGGTAFSGLIGCDRINGNVSFSIIWYNRLNNSYYRIQKIYLRKIYEYDLYIDRLLPLHGNTQLLMENWNDVNLFMQYNTWDDLVRLRNK